MIYLDAIFNTIDDLLLKYDGTFYTITSISSLINFLIVEEMEFLFSPQGH